MYYSINCITLNNIMLSDKEQFYKMLLKFEKRHPEFNATSMMLKLYPSIDCNQFKSI